MAQITKKDVKEMIEEYKDERDTMFSLGLLTGLCKMLNLCCRKDIITESELLTCKLLLSLELTRVEINEKKKYREDISTAIKRLRELP